MKRGIKYIRVSDDDQLKGYSPADQRERLDQYYLANNIQEVAVYNEDHSAKNFERPGWQKLSEYIKANWRTIDFIHVTNWSRFSRNTEQALFWIRKLATYDIEVQAIEQPIDFKAPESRMILNVYLTIPEVENYRRSSNTRNGMRRALKEGRWPAPAPFGYLNRREEISQRAIIIPDPKSAHLVSQAFRIFSEGIYSLQELRIIMNRKGLQLRKSQFQAMMRKSLYCGKIIVPATKEEPETVVQGIHDPLIDEHTFNQVQDILNGRRKKAAVFYTRRDELPLRGYLICGRCERKLTGSASTGRGMKYYYYHCTNGCKERIPVGHAHKAFDEILRKLQFGIEVKELYRDVLKDITRDQQQETEAAIRKLQEKITQTRKMIDMAQDHLNNEVIMPADYKSMVGRYQDTIADHSREISEMEHQGSMTRLYDRTFNIVTNLRLFYKQAELEEKQQIIASIFPEKIVFEMGEVRTVGLNEIVAYSCGLQNEQALQSAGLSGQVPGAGIEPA